MRIVALDIETRPGEAYFWRTGQQFVSLDMVKEQPKLLCFAAKTQGARRAEFFSEWEHGQKGMAEAAHRILDEADVILHFNGKRFDTPWLRTVLKQAKLDPPSPFKEIDLYQQTKRFQLASHKLQNVSTHLVNVGGKESTGGFGLWRAVMAGDEKARRQMKTYNIRDVDVLFEVFEELRPWIKLPNAQLYGAEAGSCPRCGSTHVQSRGFAYTAMSTFRQYQCQNPTCKGWFRSNSRLSGVDTTELTS